MVIAIDGPAASGKGTLSRRLSTHYGWPCLDTGLLYRAVARTMMDQGIAPDDMDAAARIAGALDPSTFDEKKLRGAQMGEAASVISALPAVREALIGLQRDFAGRSPGAILDGRDIGTVICPDAEVKIFVTATSEERARRRWLELSRSGDPISFKDVLADIHRRDARDSGRSTAPLRMAEDARLLDTTKLDIEAAFRVAVGIVEERLSGRATR
jgi:cytidylate kinase